MRGPARIEGAVLGVDGVDVQVVHVVEELPDPVLDVVLARDLLAACLDDDVVGHEPPAGVRQHAGQHPP